LKQPKRTATQSIGMQDFGFAILGMVLPAYNEDNSFVGVYIRFYSLA
jgi:hypothetical protein